MAIYRAVGQNTYKFVTETNFTLSQDLTVPNRAFAFPVLKYNNTSASDPGDKYLLFSPGYSTKYSGTNIYINKSTTNTSTTFSYSEMGKGWLTSCVVDGNTYYGTKSSTFYAWIDYHNSTKPTYYIKPASFKVIKYQASSDTIVIENYSTASVSYSSTYSSNTYYCNYIYMYIPKQDNDIILAIETTFPDEE